MGNSSRAVVDAAKRKKKKKKGRPSLLDLQKRSLRLHKQQQQQQHINDANNLSPNPNPHLRFPQSATTASPSSSSSRRVTRRNPNPPQDDPSPAPDAGRDDDEEDEDGGSHGRRREKKLNLVLRLPSGSAGSASDSDADAKRRKIGHVDRDEKAEGNNSTKAIDSIPGDQSDLGPTTPLPDKKSLELILDKLQKKDTYGVYSEPVDPEELPDYHEVIEHPMDFGTVRKKLLNGAYANLEQFENDVFLISSNAMRYNAPDTIYYRQARSIQELAKKKFESSRQASNDNELEPKAVVRRGRPPKKNKKLGRPPTDRSTVDFSSDTALANSGNITHWSNLAHDTSRKGSSGDKPDIADISHRSSYGLRSTDTFGRISEQKADRNEDYSGSSLKGIPTKYGKKPIVVDEGRRNTYTQSLMSTYTCELPIFTTFDGEKKQLIPVGLHFEHAYARSLARFAAKLGPVGWFLASKKIQRVLLPGTQFGPGWVGDSEAPLLSQPPLLSTSPPHPPAKPIISPCTTTDKHPQGQEMPQNDSVVNEGHFRTVAPASTSAVPREGFPEDPLFKRATYENDLSTSASGGTGSDTIWPKAPFEHLQNPGMQPTINGFNASFNFNMVSQHGMIRPAGMLSGPFGSDARMTHAQALDMASRATNNHFIHHQTAERPMVPDNPSMINSGTPLPVPGNDSKGGWQGLTLQPKSDSVPPDLNIRFHSPGSPASGVVIDSQQPDLALQL